MGRNRWDEDPDVQAMRGRSSGSTRWGRVFWGLLLVGMATFAAAYYVPLFRAHDTLSKEHRRVLEDVKTGKQALEASQLELKKATARKDELEAERAKKEAGNAQASTALESLKSQASGKLDKLIKKGQAEVGVAEGRAVVAVSDAAVFSKKLELVASAKPWLCELAQLAGAKGLRVRALDDDSPPAPPHSTKYPTTWSLRAARAATVAEALETLCSVPAARIELTGVAGSRPNAALANSKLPPQHIEFEF